MSCDAARHWPVQRLVGFIERTSAATDVPTALLTALDTIMEVLDAEVGTLVGPGGVTHVRGLGQVDPRGLPEDLGDLAARTGRDGWVTTRIDLADVDLPGTVVPDIVVARSTSTFGAHERVLIAGLQRALVLVLHDLDAAARQEAALQRLQEANRRLRDLDRQKDDFVSMSSHELRTPTTAIFGLLEVAVGRRDEIDPEMREELLRRALQQAARQRRLVDNLLDLSRLEAGGMQPEPETVDLVDTIEELAARHPAADDIAVTAAATVQIRFDPTHLERVVVNLLDNAHNYGHPPIEVTIRTEDERTATVAVSDDGPGVPDEFVPQLFERFAQASTGNRRAASGTGLGLAIVRSLVELNSGTIRYATPPGGGAAFVVELPRAAAAGAAGAA